MEQTATTVDPTTTAAALTSADGCPRCKKPLIDPSGLGWCKACGYCRSLETEHAHLAAETGPSRTEVFAGAAGNVPLWFWLLLVGVAAMAGLSLAAGRLLPAGDNFQRAIWTSLQVVSGIALIFGAQLVVLLRIAHEDEKLSFKDAIVPTRLWSLVAKRLPRLAGCVWVATWGLALVVFAFVFVGGLGHWYSYLPGAKNPPKTVTKINW